MSYVDKKDGEKKESESVLKAMFADSTVVESPEDVIEKDTDVNRKNAFKKAYDRLLALLPDSKEKKKKRKTKEDFDKSLNVRTVDQTTKTQAKAREENTMDRERE